MTIELRISRGWRIWVNGKTTRREWEIGTDYEQGAGNYTVSQKGKPLKVGGLNLTGIGFDIPEMEWAEGNKPTMLTIFDEKGTPTQLMITKVAWGTTDDDEPVKVRLVNGETLELDEITTYIIAEA